LVLRLLLPAQKADGEEQSVRATLGKVVPDLPVKIDQSCLEFGCAERRGQFVPEQCFGRETALQVLAVDVAIKRGIALAERILLGKGYDPDRAPARQPILEIGDVRAEKRDGLPRIRKIEEPVAKGEVEQFLLPPVDAAGSRRRLHLDGFDRQFAEGWRRGQGQVRN